MGCVVVIHTYTHPRFETHAYTHLGQHSECGTKVEALRRTALRKLPPVLIIHLKRFEFDLESMTKFKVRRTPCVCCFLWCCLVAVGRL